GFEFEGCLYELVTDRNEVIVLGYVLLHRVRNRSLASHDRAPFPLDRFDRPLDRSYTIRILQGVSNLMDVDELHLRLLDVITYAYYGIFTWLRLDNLDDPFGRIGYVPGIDIDWYEPAGGRIYKRGRSFFAAVLDADIHDQEPLTVVPLLKRDTFE